MAITFLTSISPKAIPSQLRAISTWRQQGGRILSINSEEEIKEIKGHFPDIDFVAPRRTAKTVYGKPYPYVYEMLKTAEKLSHPREMIVLLNSDNFLVDQATARFSQIHEKLLQGNLGLIFSSRKEVDSPLGSYNIYLQGFDSFFFLAESISQLRESQFIFGLPWWDYWLPLEFERTQAIGMSVLSLTSHQYHTSRWSESSYQALSLEMRTTGLLALDESAHRVGLEALNRIYDRSTLFLSDLESISFEVSYSEIDFARLIEDVDLLEACIGLTRQYLGEALLFNSSSSRPHPLCGQILDYLVYNNESKEPFMVLFDSFQNAPGRHNQRWRNVNSISRDLNSIHLILCGAFVNLPQGVPSQSRLLKIVHVNFPLISIDQDFHFGISLLLSSAKNVTSEFKINHKERPSLLIWGAGEKLYREINGISIFFEVVAICDSNPKRIGASIDAYCIESPSKVDISNIKFLYIASEEFLEEITLQARRLFPDLIILNSSDSRRN
jgi:hypothetical protein